MFSRSLSRCSFDKDAMVRALYGRLSHIRPATMDNCTINKPIIHYTEAAFVHGKQWVESNASVANDKVGSCSTSLIWYKRPDESNLMEVSVDGYRQGATKKARNSAKARLSICRANMFKHTHIIFDGLDTESRGILLGRQNLPAIYQDCKDLVSYSVVWNWLASSDDLFKLWIRKERKYSMFAEES